MKILLNEQQLMSFLIEMTKQEINKELKNVDTNPTEAQKSAGNYKKGHIRICGFDITIENPKGSYRKYKNNDGSEGKNLMKNHYGYFNRTKGKDGDAVDVFIGNNIKNIEKVFIIDQNDNDGNFDESKVMLGFNSSKEAKQAYLNNYSKDWKGFRTITCVSMPVFKKWLYRGRKQKIPFAEYILIKKSKMPLKENDLKSLWNNIKDNPQSDSKYLSSYDNWKQVRKNGKMNLFNTEDKKLISKQWFDWIGFLINGFAIISENGKYNFIDKDGVILSPIWFYDVDNFEDDGTAKVSLLKNGEIQTTRINTDGNFIK